MRSLIASMVAVFAVLSRDIAASPAPFQCETGADDILGSKKAFAVQVCNLFGSTCVVNHPATDPAECGDKALEISHGECKLYPIYEYAGREYGSDGEEHLSTARDLGCTVSYSSSNGVESTSYSGACVSVSCMITSSTFANSEYVTTTVVAGPAFRGTTSQTNDAATPITDTGSHTFLSQDLASIPLGAQNSKTVFLSRTGDFVGTSTHREISLAGLAIGDLPTAPSSGNYGPVACPSQNQALDSAAATGITAEDLRMCGLTDKYSYFLGVNLLQDTTLHLSVSGDIETDETCEVAASASDVDMGSVAFLSGGNQYYEELAMDDPRKIYISSEMSFLNGGKHILGSEIIQPLPGTRDAFKDEIGGTWRSFGVAFYCKDHARKDLTVCENGPDPTSAFTDDVVNNVAAFYFCDPNPNACFGTTAEQISSNLGRLGEPCTVQSDCCLPGCFDGTCGFSCDRDQCAPQQTQQAGASPGALFNVLLLLASLASQLLA